jgi:hypothetical protein
MNKTQIGRGALAVSLGVAAAAIGCGDLNTIGEDAESAALSGRATKPADPDCERVHDPRSDRDHRFHKRCEHYQQKHRRRGGSSGTAVLTTRALMDATRMTELEATTGKLDDPSNPPGKIEELRVEVADTSKKSRDARTVTAKDPKQGGTVVVPLPKLVHGQSLTISARISGIDRGEDRVSVDDEVRYRPDLAVGALSVSGTPTAGLPTDITAVVREMMGDEGAKADCVLSVDGAAVDRSVGIWVDSGSMVTCHFVQTFSAPGVHRLAVDVLGVAPRDYNPANNHAEATINAAANFTFSGSVYDASYSGEDVEDVVDSIGAILYHRTDSWRGVNQSMAVTGTWPSAVTFPLAAVSALATSGGATWPLISLTSVQADSADDSGTTCASRNDDAGYNWIGICSRGGDSPATQISVSTFAGEVTYHSEGVCQTTSAFYDCMGGYTWNSGSDVQPTTRHPLSGGVTFSLGIADGGGAALQAAPVIPVASFATTDASTRTCEPQPDGTQHCFSHKYGEAGVSGSSP